MAYRISSALLETLIAAAPPVADPIAVSPGFLKRFAAVLPGEGFFSVYRLGAGETAVYRVRSAETFAPLLRLRVNSRSVHVEVRSGNRWRGVERLDTPRAAQAWTRLAKRITAAAPTLIKSRTDTTRNVKHPRLGGGRVTRAPRTHLPQALAWGWAPASGRSVRTHTEIS